MKITLLGTGTSQGVPVIGCTCKVCKSDNPKDNRLRTSALLSWDDFKFVIDCGPDFRIQMLGQKIKSIDGILFTHEHADHTAGLDDIRPIYFNNKKPLPIYGLKRVMDELAIRFNYIFTKAHRYPGAPEVEVNYLQADTPFQLGDKEVMPLGIMHGNLPILGYKIDRFAYLTDTKTIPDKTMNHLYNLDVLVLNALHHKRHKMHLNIEEALEVIAKLKPKKAILTHISHHFGLYDEIQQKLPKNVIIGYDGMEIEV